MGRPKGLRKINGVWVKPSGSVAQQVERVAVNHDVVGSSPTRSAGVVAQQVERPSPKPSSGLARSDYAY